MVVLIVLKKKVYIYDFIAGMRAIQVKDMYRQLQIVLGNQNMKIVVSRAQPVDNVLKLEPLAKLSQKRILKYFDPGMGKIRKDSFYRTSSRDGSRERLV